MFIKDFKTSLKHSTTFHNVGSKLVMINPYGANIISYLSDFIHEQFKVKSCKRSDKTGTNVSRFTIAAQVLHIRETLNSSKSYFGILT